MTGWLDPELWRLKGEILEPKKAETIEYFVRAVDLIRSNGSKLLELRAATSLAAACKCRDDEMMRVVF